MERPDEFDEDDLMAFSRGTVSPDVAARIKAAAVTNEALRAELAVMSGLKDALEMATDGPDAREFGWRRLEAEISKSAEHKLRKSAHPTVWRIAAMFLGALVIAQGAYISLGLRANDTPVFRTVSEELVGFSLNIAFAPDAPMAEIETLLRETDARVIDGPTANGFYQLSFETEDALSAARVQLSSSPLVDLVEGE